MIDLKDIKKLRNLTKAGVMDCRKALQQARGDFDKAKKHLKEKSIAIAEKKKNRETKAGLIKAYIHNGNQVGAIIKLSCETDFVAQTKELKELAHELAMQVAAMKPKNVKELLEQEYIRDSKKKVKDLVKETIGKIRENIKVEEIARLEI